MKNWIVNNFWIKAISLMLAVITWFYVNGELEKEKRLSRKFYNSELYKSYLLDGQPSSQTDSQTAD